MPSERTELAVLRLNHSAKAPISTFGGIEKDQPDGCCRFRGPSTTESYSRQPVQLEGGVQALERGLLVEWHLAAPRAPSLGLAR